MKKIIISMLLFLIPVSTIFAYSKEVVVGGDNIGIEVKTNGVLVIGLYEVNGYLNAKDSNISTGDYIVGVNGNRVYSINDLSSEISKDEDKEYLDITYLRDNNTYDTKLKLELEDNEYKTGLYVKDTVNGIGTLTVIDPISKRFLALGHQIQDSNSNKILNISNGKIYKSYITGIKKSSNGFPGEKEAVANFNENLGRIDSNTNKGIFGYYDLSIDNSKIMSIASKDEIKTGDAYIRTVLNGDEIKEFKIKIDEVNKKDELKGILFTIVDEELLSITGGVIQGMSGSPIIQDNKVIGAVTHVIVDDCKRGYGIFIENMLEESEKDLN